MRLQTSAVLLLLIGTIPLAVYADYTAGLRAYQAKDFAGALREWLPLAEQGDVKSQSGMCSLYYRGNGVQQSYEEAMRWCRKAADQGSAASQNTVGILYHFGRGVQQNAEEATRWYQKAADQGLTVAQNNLGYRFLRGEGASQDYIKAEMWFSLSGPGSDQEDADARAEVAKHLTPEEMSRALRMAQEWRANRVARPSVITKDVQSTPSSPQAAAPISTPPVKILPAGAGDYRWSITKLNCDISWANGRPFETMTVGDIKATVTLWEDPASTFVSFVQVWNLGDRFIEISPTTFTIQITNPQGTRLAAFPPGHDVLKPSITQGILAMIAGGAQGYSDASLKRTASATVTNPDGSSSQVDIYSTGPTPQEVEQRRQAAQARADEAAARNAFNQNMRTFAFTYTNLEPHKFVDGAVWFPREKKKYREVLIRIPIYNTLFEFPFTFQ